MTLTELSYYSRRALPFVIIFFLLMLIVFYLFQLIFLYLDLTRTEKVSINPIFGKLSSIKLNNLISKKFDYILDTVEGEPISASASAKVYLLPPSTPLLTYRERVYLLAKNLGFDVEKTKYQLEDREAVFKENGRSLRIDISNFNFTYQLDLGEEQSFLLDYYIPKREEVESRAKDYLKNLGRYPNELALGKINIIYLKYDPLTKTMIIVDQPSYANLVEVDFYRQEIDGIPVVSPTYFNSQNYLIFGFSQKEIKLIKAQIRFYERSEQEFGIYPIKSGQEAWQDLVEGKGLIVSAPEGVAKIKIKKMFFAYLDPDIYQDYLQPVYVFLGENNFVGYVPAVIREYYLER